MQVATVSDRHDLAKAGRFAGCGLNVWPLALVSTSFRARGHMLLPVPVMNSRIRSGIVGVSALSA